MSYLFDHRQLADEMEIFVFDDRVGAGLPLWLPNGVAIRDELENFIRDLEHQEGYQRVACPHIGGQELYDQSGHLEFFKQNMFPPMKWPGDNREYHLKPMNCPHHHLVFSSMPRSHRSLPLRIAEYGQVYRFEASGALHGLSRVRSLCQNDAHIYVEPGVEPGVEPEVEPAAEPGAAQYSAQASEEIARVLDLHERCYRALGLSGHRYRLSKHDPKKPESYQGAKNLWLACEDLLRRVLKEKGLPFFEAEDEAAFYGPKIDVQMKLGKKEESIASVQLDFISGERFSLSFASRSGEMTRPWIIHRAPLGSHERFVALLLEYYDGQLPGWLSPIQLCILPVSEAELDDAKKIADSLRRAKIRVSVDESAGSLSKRILFAHKQRPFAKLILGKQELSSGVFKLQLRSDSREVKRELLAEALKAAIKSPNSANE